MLKQLITESSLHDKLTLYRIHSNKEQYKSNNNEIILKWYSTHLATNNTVTITFFASFIVLTL